MFATHVWVLDTKVRVELAITQLQPEAGAVLPLSLRANTTLTLRFLAATGSHRFSHLAELPLPVLAAGLQSVLLALLLLLLQRHVIESTKALHS